MVTRPKRRAKILVLRRCVHYIRNKRSGAMVGFTGVTTTPHRMMKFHILHFSPLLVLRYVAANVPVNNVLGSEHPFVYACRKLGQNIEKGGLPHEFFDALPDCLGIIWGIVFGSQVYWTQANCSVGFF